MKQHILKEQWTGLPSDQRIALRKKYDLRITESTEVINDRVISDGVSLQSLAAVFNVERMRAQLPHAPEDATCDDLWKLLLAPGSETSIPPEAGTSIPASPDAAKVEPVPKKRKTKKTT